jgi:hypothetical protein
MKVNHFNAANELLRSRKVEEVIAFYREAIAHNPKFYWSHHNLGEALTKLRPTDLLQIIPILPEKIFFVFN